MKHLLLTSENCNHTNEVLLNIQKNFLDKIPILFIYYNWSVFIFYMEGIVEKLDSINGTLEKMLEVMRRPENKFLSALKIIGLGVGILSILNAADIIRSWIIGG
jgi:hypothetical protein